MVIDLSLMRSVNVDPENIGGAGWNWRTLADVDVAQRWMDSA